MIEFNPDKPILPINEGQKTDSNQSPENLDFRNVFQQAISSEETKGESVESTPYLSGIRPAQFETNKEVTSNMVVDQIDSLMQTMEDYQRKLTDGEVTLKDLEPIVNKIVKQSDSLSVLSMSEGVDEGLKTIANQTLSLSSQELANYKSGVYNDEG